MGEVHAFVLLAVFVCIVSAVWENKYEPITLCVGVIVIACLVNRVLCYFNRHWIAVFDCASWGRVGEEGAAGHF